VLVMVMVMVMVNTVVLQARSDNSK